MSNVQTLNVNLADRSYDILVGPGLIARAGALIAECLSGKRAVILTDDAVGPLYCSALQASLDSVGIASSVMSVPSGEGSKSFDQLQDLLNQSLDVGLDRKSFLVALGGGVVGDLGGFLAAILLRGIDYVQIPTTLLSQVDSSVGGKTAINTKHGKNLVGAFHQPRLVLADTDALASLPRRELLSGYAEVAKYGLIDQPDFWSWLEVNAPRVLALEPEALTHAVVTSCRAKAAVVAEDEREGGARALLNLGHTFGHAIEAEVGYGGQVVHGEAVSIGMALAFRHSVKLGLCDASAVERVERHLSSVDLPVRPLQVMGQQPPTIERLMARMASDKKAEGGQLTLILAKGIGQSFIAKGADAAAVEQTWAEALAS
ncbi:MAG: 3-dehydroquinate synthase [Alphaproteobacteria bacterium]|jgi:3-dehydroquinate synthase